MLDRIATRMLASSLSRRRSAFAIARSTSSTSPRRSAKVTPAYLARRKRARRPFTVVTAYDWPSACHADAAGVDVVLVGDSCAMVELGHPTTQAVTVDEMLHHCRAVRRGLDHGFGRDDHHDGAGPPPMLVADMPLGSYEVSAEDALRNAHRFVKEAGADAVKTEGGSVRRAATVERLVRDGGVAVVGHVGLTPQSVGVAGGVYRARGRTAHEAAEILDDARRLQDAGAFAVVLECVPANVAAAVTDELEIPTIGIGAGPRCDGQVLVYHDLLGMNSTPTTNERRGVPSFVKTYADLGDVIQRGLRDYRREVEEGVFPGEDGRYSPYRMTEDEETIFDELTGRSGTTRTTRTYEEVEDETDDEPTTTLYGK